MTTLYRGPTCVSTRGSTEPRRGADRGWRRIRPNPTWVTLHPGEHPAHRPRDVASLVVTRVGLDKAGRLGRILQHDRKGRAGLATGRAGRGGGDDRVGGVGRHAEHVEHEMFDRLTVAGAKSGFSAAPLSRS